MPEVDVRIAGRNYRVGCRSGEEDKLRRAAELVDSRSRDALSGLGTMSESRQLLLSALLIAAEMLDKGMVEAPSGPDPAIGARVEALAARLESLAEVLDNAAASP